MTRLDWLTAAADHSARDGYLYWMGSELYGVKWRNFKLVLVAQRYMQDPASKLPTPRLINLITDPQERDMYLVVDARRSDAGPRAAHARDRSVGAALDRASRRGAPAPR